MPKAPTKKTSEKKADKTSEAVPLLTCIDVMSGASIPRRNFYILSGNDLFAFSRIVETLKEMFLADDPSGFNFVRFDADANTKASGIISVCEEYPFGSQYKLIIVANSQKMAATEGEKIKKYLEHPSPTSILVLEQFEEDGKGPAATKFNPLRSLKSALVKHGLHISCTPDVKDIRKWLTTRFEKEGKKTGAGVVDHLISLIGTDMWELHQEVSKLVLYVGKRSVITEEDVRTITASRPQSKIFNLNEEVGAKRISKALTILDDLFRDKTVGVQILAALQNHFTFLFKIRSLLDTGETTDGIAKILHKHPYYIKKSAQQAMNFSRESFDSVFDLIARADAGIKTGLDERMVMELTLIQICKMKG